MNIERKKCKKCDENLYSIYFDVCIICKNDFCDDCIYNDEKSINRIHKICNNCNENRKTVLEKFDDLYNYNLEMYKNGALCIESSEKSKDYHYIKCKSIGFSFLKYNYKYICKRRRSI